jgi:putative lipoprotein
MTYPRSLLLLLLPIFAGCQAFSWRDEPSRQAVERLQGEVTRNEGMLLLRSCQGQRQVELLDTGTTGLYDDAQALLSDSGRPLFADVRGRLISRADGSSQMQLTQVYRLQSEGPGCDASGFNQLALRAGGHEPGWSVRITTKGLLLERPGQAPLAVPYLEEQLPGGQTNFSSEANSQRIDLWVAPQRCVDGATGAVSHLTAELRLDNQTLRGCAYYGGARNE